MKTYVIITYQIDKQERKHSFISTRRLTLPTKRGAARMIARVLNHDSLEKPTKPKDIDILCVKEGP